MGILQGIAGNHLQGLGNDPDLVGFVRHMLCKNICLHINN